MTTARDAIDWHSQIAVRFDEKYSQSADFQERYAVWSQLIERYSNPGSHVLDIGCGSGIFSVYAAALNKTVVGIDGSAEMLKLCEQRTASAERENVRFMQAELGALPARLDATADLVICSSVLEYVDDLDLSLERIRGLLKKGGIFMFSMPNKQGVFRKIEPLAFKIFRKPKYYQYVKHVASLSEMRSRLAKLGFSILETEYYGATPVLSKLFHQAGISRYSDNLFVAVARLAL